MAASATLRVSADGRTVTVDKDVFAVGRSKECDLRLDYPLVSATHVRLLRSAAGNYFVHDCSANGTSVNEVRLRKGQRAPLADGDLVHLVKTKRHADRNLHLQFNVAASPAPADVDATQRLSESEEEGAGRTVSVSPADCDGGGESAATMPLQLGDAEEVEPPAAKVPRIERVATQLNKALSHESSAAGPSAAADGAAGAATARSDSGDDALVATLSCSICQDVFHRCVTLTPCNHKFCAGCFSDCLRRSSHCPMCRAKAQSVGRDQTCDAVVENLLKRRPDLRRPPSDTAALDAKSVIGNDNKTVGELRAALRAVGGKAGDDEQGGGDELDEEEEDDMDDEEEEETDESGYDDDAVAAALCCAPRALANANVSRCRQCPAAAVGTGASSTGGVYVCPPDGGHVLCQCCVQPMPAAADKKLTRCAVCSTAYCHAYWTCRPCRGAATGGCINRLANLPPYMPAVVNGNAYESRLLIAHLQQEQVTGERFERELLASVRAGTAPPLVSLRHFGGRAPDADALLCRHCADLVWSDLAFDYCRRNGVRGGGPARTDCWYGRNCRTQRHRAQHAARLNHICEQIKFD